MRGLGKWIKLTSIFITTLGVVDTMRLAVQNYYFVSIFSPFGEMILNAKAGFFVFLLSYESSSYSLIYSVNKKNKPCNCKDKRITRVSLTDIFRSRS